MYTCKLILELKTYENEMNKDRTELEAKEKNKL